jgi:hypothetical protein
MILENKLEIQDLNYKKKLTVEKLSIKSDEFAPPQI